MMIVIKMKNNFTMPEKTMMAVESYNKNWRKELKRRLGGVKYMMYHFLVTTFHRTPTTCGSKSNQEKMCT